MRATVFVGIIIAMQGVLSGGVAYTAESGIQEKLRVHCAMHEVVSIARSSKGLEEFGKKTMIQSKQLLDGGVGGIEVWGKYHNAYDWKVRFWVADMLGYFPCAVAERILSDICSRTNEEEKVVVRAQESLNKIKNSRQSSVAAVQ